MIIILSNQYLLSIPPATMSHVWAGSYVGMFIRSARQKEMTNNTGQI